MKIARELNLEKSLEQLAQEQLDVLQDEKVRVVFYKEEGKWQTNVIVLQDNNTVNERDIKTLKWIKSVDNQAVVMGKRDFMKDWKDELISLDEAVYTIEYRHGNVDCHNNISKFLEKSEEENNIKMMKESYKQWSEENSDIALQKLQQQPTTLKFDNKKFSQSKLGSMLCHRINRLNTAILKHEYEYEQEYNIFEEITVIKALLVAIKQCYGATYYIAFNQEKCGIFSPDTNDWLFE